MKEKLDKLCNDCVEFTNMDSKNCCLVIAGTKGEMGVTAMLGNKKNLFEHLVNAIMDDYENRDALAQQFVAFYMEGHMTFGQFHLRSVHGLQAFNEFPRNAPNYASALMEEAADGHHITCCGCAAKKGKFLHQSRSQTSTRSRNGCRKPCGAAPGNDHIVVAT